MILFTYIYYGRSSSRSSARARAEDAATNSLKVNDETSAVTQSRETLRARQLSALQSILQKMRTTALLSLLSLWTEMTAVRAGILIAVAATASVYVDAVREAGLPQRRAVRSHPLRLRRLSPRVRRRRSVGTQEGARPRLPRQHRRRCSKSELLCPAEGSLALDEFRFISVWRPHAI